MRHGIEVRRAESLDASAHKAFLIALDQGHLLQQRLLVVITAFSYKADPCRVHFRKDASADSQGRRRHACTQAMLLAMLLPAAAWAFLSPSENNDHASLTQGCPRGCLPGR